MRKVERSEGEGSEEKRRMRKKRGGVEGREEGERKGRVRKKEQKGEGREE